MSNDLLTLFMEYAQDFEKSFEDDDWTRVYKYLWDDASYEIKGDAPACLLKGPEAIFKGIKKSLDGFDRRFDTRELGLEGELEVTDDSLALNWSGKYGRAGAPEFVLYGRSEVNYRDGKIASFSDEIATNSMATLQAWVKETGVELDFSYA